MFNNRIVIAQKELFISIFNQFGKIMLICHVYILS
jgi:hypothetical protein